VDVTLVLDEGLGLQDVEVVMHVQSVSPKAGKKPGAQPPEVASLACTVNGASLVCPGLGIASIDDHGDRSFTVGVRELNSTLGGRIVGLSPEGAEPEPEGVRWTWENWGNGCELTATDQPACEAMGDKCGYRECNAANGVSNPFGGCWLSCHCQTDQGVWVEDMIDHIELREGDYQCNGTMTPVGGPIVEDPPTTDGL